MASWFGGLSSSIGYCLGQMSLNVVSFTRHISRCAKDVSMMEYKTEKESNELRGKEGEITKETMRTKVERIISFYSDLDHENQQETAANHNLLIKRELDMKPFIEEEILVPQKIQNLQEDTQAINVAAGFVPALSSTLLGKNIKPKVSEYKHEFKQKNLEVDILSERHEAMNHKLLKLQKATESINATTTVIPAMPALITLGDNIKQNDIEHEHQLKQKNLQMKILRGRNVAMKRKLLKLQKATECLNEAAGLLPATSSTSLGENIVPSASEYEEELRQKNLEVKILRGRNVVMKHKLLKLRQASRCVNAAAGLIAATPASTSPGDNINHNASENKNQLEQQNLEMKILRGRNVAMKHKLLKLQKATECLNAAAGLVPATSSTSLGENIDPNVSEYKHQLEEKNLEMRILRERHAAMKRKLLKLQNTTECLNAAAAVLPATSSTSLGENIDPSGFECNHHPEEKNLEMKILRERHGAMKQKSLKLQSATDSVNLPEVIITATSASTSLGDNVVPSASEYEHDTKQEELKMQILRGRNVAMKCKSLKLQKVSECLNEAAGLLPAISSTSLGENIIPSASKYEHELKQKDVEVKILRERHGAMTCELLKPENATPSINVGAGLVVATLPSGSLSDNIDHSDSEYEHQLKQQNLEMQILRGRNVAMKRKLLKLQKATECLNEAAGLLPATSSTSLGENIVSIASEYEHELRQKNLEVKILRGRNVVMKHKLLNLQKANRCVNAAAGVIAATPASNSQGDKINHNASEYENQLEQQNLEMKILRGRNVAMKHKLLKLQKATESLNVAAGLVPATTSTSLGENINPNVSEYKHQLEEKNLEMRILRERHAAMERKLLKLQNTTECLNATAAVLPATSSTSLGENIDPSGFVCNHHLEEKNLEMKMLRERHGAMKQKSLKLQSATDSVNLPEVVITATSASTSLGDNVVPSASEYENEPKQEELKMQILKGRNVAMKCKSLKLQNTTEGLNAAAGLPATSSTSPGENINPNASKYEHELKQKDVEGKILRERHGAMSRELLKLENATPSMNVGAGLMAATPASSSLGDNTDHTASEYEHQLKQQNLEMKILRGRNVAMKRKLLKLQKASECLNEPAGLLPATSSTSLGENFVPSASEYEHELRQKNLEVKILRGRNVVMKHKLLNLQKANRCVNAAAGVIAAMPASTSPGDNIDHNASEYKNQLEQQNLEMKILRGRNVAMKHKLLKLQKATECLNAAAGLVPATSSTSLDENIDPNVSEYKHQLEEKSREMKILRKRHAAMKRKLLKLQNTTEGLNAAAAVLPATSSTPLGENIDPSGFECNHLEEKNLKMKILRERHGATNRELLKPENATASINAAAVLIVATPASSSLGDNIDHSASEYEHQLKQQNVEMKILRRRNVTMKRKLLKPRKASECLNEPAGLLPAMSSTSVGENIVPSASEYEHELRQKNLEVKILRGRNVVMKHKLLKLTQASRCVNAAAGLIAATPASTSPGDNIDHNASEYKNQLEQQNLEMKILRGRNVAMKHKLLKLQKATECLNAAAGLVPATSSTSLGENIDPNVCEYKHQLEEKSREIKILRKRHAAMKRKLLKLQNATECLNAVPGFIPAMSPSTSLGGNIHPNVCEYEQQLDQQNLEMKILRHRNVAMKHKLLKLRNATQCLNAAAGLIPVTSSTSLGDNIDPNSSEYKHELEQENPEVILRERHGTMNRELIKLENVTECINAATGLKAAMPASTFLGDNIDHSASEYEHYLEQQNLEMKILRGRNVAMKRKLLKLQKATECLNEAAGLLPVTSLGENIDPNVSEYKHELEQKTFEVKILRGRNVAMKHKLLTLKKATQYLNQPSGLIPALHASTSLGDTIDHNAPENKSQPEEQNLKIKILRGRNVAMKYKLLKLLKATECVNVAAGLVLPTSSTSLDENIAPNVSEYKQHLEEKNLEMRILRERHTAMKCKLLKLQKAAESINAAAGLIPASARTE